MSGAADAIEARGEARRNRKRTIEQRSRSSRNMNPEIPYLIGRCM